MLAFFTSPSGSIIRPIITTAHTRFSFRQHHSSECKIKQSKKLRTAFKSPFPINYCLINLSCLCKFPFSVPCLARVNVPSEPCSILGLALVRGPRGSRARLRHIQLQYAPHLSCTPHKVSAKSAEIPSWRTIRISCRRYDSRGQKRAPQSLSLRIPLWNDLDFVPGRVKPRSICSTYPTMPPPEFHDWVTGRISELYKQNLSVRSLLVSPKVFRAAVDVSPDFAHTHNQHQGDFHIQAVLRSSVDDQNDYSRGSPANIDVDKQPSFHHVKQGRAKDARRHGLVHQLFARNSRPNFPTSFEGNTWKHRENENAQVLIGTLSFRGRSKNALPIFETRGVQQLGRAGIRRCRPREGHQNSPFRG